MKHLILRILGATLLLAGTLAQAQSLVASNTTTSVNTLNHAATISFTPGADSGTFDFTLTYNATLMTSSTADVTASIPNGTTNCSVSEVAGTGTVSCITNANSSSTDLAAGTITVLFDIGPTVGVSPLTFVVSNFFAQTGGTEPGTTTNGSVTINAGPQPEFDAVPTNAAPRTLTGSIGAPASETITVTNIGQAGSTLTVSAAATDTGAGTLTVAPAGPVNLAQNANQAFTVTCDSAVVETFTGTVTFTTNDSDEGSVVYNYTCMINATPAPVYSSAPPPPGPINITAAVGGSNTATLTVSNTGNATLNLSAPTGLSAPLSISPNTAQSIASGGSPIPYTITCTPTDTTLVTQTLSITHNAAGSPATYTVTCQGTAPVYSSAPPPPGPITITTPAGTPGTATLTVSNTGTAGSTLTVTPSGLSAPLSISPNTTQNIDTVTPVTFTITCNSADAGTFTQTLTMTHNAAGSPATYTVTCTSTGPEFSSAPAPGGTVSMSGIAGTTATGSITVTNSGNVALTVTCTPPAAPFTITSANPLTVGPGTSGAITISCAVPAAAGTTVTQPLSCTTNDANEPTANYTLSCSSLQTSIPTLSNAGKLLLGALMLGLGFLGFGLRRHSA